MWWVDDTAGTTRDAIELSVNRNGREFILKDTAGIRRKGKVTDKLEKFSILKALDSMEECDVALIVIDCSEGITDQDITIAGYAEKRGCGAIFLLNKWDLVDKSEKRAAGVYQRVAPEGTVPCLCTCRYHFSQNRPALPQNF